MPTIIKPTAVAPNEPANGPARDPISVVLSPRQRAELFAEARRFRDYPTALTGVFVLTTILLGAYLIWRAVHEAALSPVPFVLAGGIYAVLFLVFALYRFGTQATLDATYELTAQGLHVSTGPRMGIVRWSQIARIIDTGNAFLVVRYQTSPPLIIPKAAVAGDASALWADLDRYLTGPKLLIRSGTARTTIVNTLAPPKRKPAVHGH